MISVIVCSRSKDLPTEFRNNILKTIGCEYELIVIDNSSNRYSIFEAYNQGIEKSIYDILCFIHDDIFFKSKDWGIVLKEIFSIGKIGLVGVAGAKSKSKTPSLWRDIEESHRVVNIYQSFKGTNKQTEFWYGGFNKNEEEVVVMDGVFIAARKDKRFKFDKSINGFHNYDFNICMEYHKLNFKSIITNRITLEHKSVGLMNSNWLETSLYFTKKYKDLLPISIHKNYDFKKIEIKNKTQLINLMFKYDKFDGFIFYWSALLKENFFSKFHLIIVRKSFSFFVSKLNITIENITKKDSNVKIFNNAYKAIENVINKQCNFK